MAEADRVRVTVLVDDYVSTHRIPLYGEHGFSALIEVECSGRTRRVLLDAGYTGYVLLRNAELLGIDLAQVDAVVVSHRHYDHTGGLAELLRVNRRARVVAHPLLERPVYVLKPKPTQIGVPEPVLKALRGRLSLSREPLEVVPGVYFLGEVERRHPEEKCEGFYAKSSSGYEPDPMLDDTGVAVKLPGGAVVITGCAHSGVVNTVEHALRVLGVQRVEAVIGGFHLKSAPPERIAWTVEKIRAFSPRVVAPVHCSGLAIKAALLRELGEVFVDAGVGSRIDID